MMRYTKLTELARRAIEAAVRERRLLTVVEGDVPLEWQNEGACFVTLNMGGKLRGCIGTIEARQPLYKDVIENTGAAALRDWRFAPVTEAELSLIEIEVSVLSEPETYQFEDEDKLLADLERDKPGLIIEKRGRRAVFLPQVWEQLPEPELFLGQLCLKAGLSADDWRREMVFNTFIVTAKT